MARLFFAPQSKEQDCRSVVEACSPFGRERALAQSLGPASPKAYLLLTARSLLRSSCSRRGAARLEQQFRAALAGACSPSASMRRAEGEQFALAQPNFCFSKSQEGARQNFSGAKVKPRIQSEFAKARQPCYCSADKRARRVAASLQSTSYAFVQARRDDWARLGLDKQKLIT